MKNKFLITLISLYLIQFVSAYSNSDLPPQSELQAELAQASLGNNIFFGTLVSLLVIVLIVYLITMLKKRKNN
jgi:heme/copper-type cytochrome/quinol oxidase subunit 2